MKKKKIIKLIAIISVLVILAGLICTTIVLALAKRDYNINVKNPTKIRIYSSENTTGYKYTFNSGEEEYNKIMELYNASFKEDLLTLLFAGELGTKNYIDDTNAENNVINNVVTDNPDKFYIEFVYPEYTSLMLNDEPFYKANSGDVVVYNKLLVEVSNSQAITETKIYVENKTTSTSDTISSSYQFITYTIQANLYAYIDSIVD